MKVMYRTVGYIRTSVSPIKEVEIERETASSVWQSGVSGAQRKRSSYMNFFDTYDEAKAFLVGNARATLDSARRAMADAEDKYEYLTELQQ